MKSRNGLPTELEENTLIRATHAFPNPIREVQSPQQVSIPSFHISDIQIRRAPAHTLIDRDMNFT